MTATERQFLGDSTNLLSMDDETTYGKVIDQLKKISAAGGTGTVVFDDGSKQPVNPAEAGKMVTLYQDLNASNRDKMIRSINTSTQGYEKVKAFAQSRT